MHIAHQRLLNQHIDDRQFKRPEEVVRWMGALQAQDYAQALWALGLRTQDATLADIEQAIAERKILRSWPMRGTLHFLPPEDAKWMLKLSAARMLARDKHRREQLEIDDMILKRTGTLFYNALQGGKRLSRPEMMAILEEAGIRTNGQRGYHLLWYMAQTGMICLGPIEKKQQTFVLLDEWVPRSREMSREESLGELATRYATSHGPATTQDFAGWAGLTLTDARAGLEMARAKLVTEKVDGQVYWMAQAASDEQPRQHVHLLPGFDEYILGYKGRDAVLAAEHANKIVPGGNGVFKPMIVVAGRIVGTWSRSQKKNALALLLQPFSPTDNLEEQASQAARRYSEFLGLPLAALTVASGNE